MDHDQIKRDPKERREQVHQPDRFSMKASDKESRTNMKEEFKLENDTGRYKRECISPTDYSVILNEEIDELPNFNILDDVDLKHELELQYKQDYPLDFSTILPVGFKHGNLSITNPSPELDIINEEEIDMEFVESINSVHEKQYQEYQSDIDSADDDVTVIDGPEASEIKNSEHPTDLPATSSQDKEYSQSSNLKTDIGGIRFPCELCNKTFTRQSHLKSHVKTHTGEKPFFCKICNRAFTRHSNLQRHTNRHTKEKPYGCDTCSRSFATKFVLIEHIKIHTGEKRHNCKICNRSFIHSTHFRSHLRKHTGEKPYVCKVCTKGFTHPSHLKSHVKTHSGEKPFNCKICNQAFARLSGLKSHSRIHTGEKPYVCKICARAFANSSHLKSHTRTHTGERPYVCKICNQAYTRLSHLNTHINTHNAEKT